jgi:gliding motility associated protien GldN
MKKVLKLSLLSFLLLLNGLVIAQIPETPTTTTTEEPTESSKPGERDPNAPLDGVVEKKLTMEKQLVDYDPVRENDIMWEKRIWRVIDTREKMNLPFTYPEEPFIKILLDGVKAGTIRGFSAIDDKFSKQMTAEEISKQLYKIDSIPIENPETGEVTVSIVQNDLDLTTIKRFRVKEVWFFDKELSRLRNRILGIAPLRDVTDDAGNFLYELNMFWVYYPECRDYLSRHTAFMEGNDANPMTWEDLLEKRIFSSYIFKESNVFDRRIQEYATGVDMLVEGEKIKQGIFNFEHDLWSF